MSDDDGTASGPLVEARAARAEGRLWRARDLLSGHVEQTRDPEALTELGEVLHEMGDLPRAGAVWFAAGAKGPDVDTAVAAWREQSHDDFAVMWHSLPAAARAKPRPPRLEALRERARRAEAVAGDAPSEDEAERAAGAGAGTEVDADADAEPEEDADGGFDAARLIAWVLAVAFVVFAVIGFVTALNWLFPG